MKNFLLFAVALIAGFVCMTCVEAYAGGGRSLAVVSGCAANVQAVQVQQQYAAPVVQRVQVQRVVQPQYVQRVQVQKVQAVRVQPVQKVVVQQQQHFAVRQQPVVAVQVGGRERITERFGLFGRLRFRSVDRR